MPSRKEIEVMYQSRDGIVATLAAKNVIEAEDILGLDRVGKFRIASDHFSKCTPAAQGMLLNSEHAHVRSAAKLADHGMVGGIS